MIRKKTNKYETSVINNYLGVIRSHYDTQDVMDLVPTHFWMGDENDGVSYELTIIPYGKTGNVSTWTFAYIVDDNCVGANVQNVITTFSSNDGALDPAFKLFMWANKYLEKDNNEYWVMKGVMEYNDAIKAMNDIHDEYKLNKKAYVKTGKR